MVEVQQSKEHLWNVDQYLHGETPREDTHENLISHQYEWIPKRTCIMFILLLLHKDLHEHFT